jgi:hypothetical protein
MSNKQITLPVLKVDTNQTLSGRFYPRAIVQEAIDEYMSRDQIKVGTLEPDLGLDGFNVDMDRVSHKVVDVWIDDSGQMSATIEVLETPMGTILQTLLDEGVSNLMMTPVAHGKVMKNNHNDMLVYNDYKIVYFGISITPENPHQ